MKYETVFDIYTEDVNKEKICGIILSFGIGSFTFIPVSGFDRGRSERSLIIRIIGNIALLENIKKIAYNIKSTNLQRTVLLSFYSCTTEIL